eukprot:TRINITY_DN83455_c0_g1_i1.p1 TRINITY_DN83455_c0_g1~~TRINITY_DN83455_c0_g1_i1.p1  ORF type:complete len:234 (-),score=26.04 TRINITY_DN83455_c0_g1_i1:21-722(-)
MAPTAQIYSRALARSPFLTHVVTAGGLYGMGDCLSQMLEKSYKVQSTGKTHYNVERTLRMTAFGLCFAGPILGTWYGLMWRGVSSWRAAQLAKTTATSEPLNWLSAFRSMYRINSPFVHVGKLQEVAVMAVADISLLQLPFLGFYFCVIGLLEGRSLSEACQRCRRDFLELWKYSFFYWCPLQILNFLIVPAKYTAVTVNVCNGLWTTILSLFRHYRDYGIADDDSSHVVRML